MKRVPAKLGRMGLSRRNWRRQAGQTIVEYTLLLVAFGIPMIYFARWLLGYLGGYYGWLTFLETTPFP